MTAPAHGALKYPARVDGIDVSWVQSAVDYDVVAGAGFRFGIYKAAEGIKGQDSTARAHAAGFRGVGMYAIPYLFLHPAQGAPELQVANLTRAMGDVWPGRVCLDFETRQWPETNAELVAFLEGAVEACLKWGALAPAVYTYPDFASRLEPELGRSSVLGQCPLWMAEYGGAQPWIPPWGYAPRAPAPWTSWALHQYSGDGGYRVPGIFGDCDRDLFNGDEHALRAWLGLPDIHEAVTLPALPDTN